MAEKLTQLAINQLDKKVIKKFNQVNLYSNELMKNRSFEYASYSADSGTDVFVSWIPYESGSSMYADSVRADTGTKMTLDRSIRFYQSGTGHFEFGAEQWITGTHLLSGDEYVLNFAVNIPELIEGGKSSKVVVEVWDSGGSTYTPFNQRTKTSGWEIYSYSFYPEVDEYLRVRTYIYWDTAAIIEERYAYIEDFGLKRKRQIENTKVISYDINFSSDFGSSTCGIQLMNPYGEFSEEKGNAIKYGDEIELIEGLQINPNLIETGTKFRGVVRQVVPSAGVGNNVCSIVALDQVVKLQDVDIFKKYQGKKQQVFREKMYPNQIDPSSSNYIADIWDFANYPIAEDKPSPVLNIRSLTYPREDPAYDGYEVSYQTGQARFGRPINYRNHNIYAKYGFYFENNYVEDIFEDIILQADSYSGSVFTLSENLMDSFSRLNSGVDFLTYNTAADTIAMRLEAVSTSGESFLKINEKDYSPKSGNSFNVVRVNSGTGQFIDAKNYDLDTEADIIQMHNDLKGYDSGTLILFASQGECVSKFFSGSLKNTLRKYVTVSPAMSGTEQFPFVFEAIESGTQTYQGGNIAFIGEAYTSSGSRPHILMKSTQGSGSVFYNLNISYDIGQIWYFKYNNWISDIDEASVNNLGVASIIDKSKRYGRLILDQTISTGTSVYYDADYNFKTIQATGIEVSHFDIPITSKNRFEAINSLRTVLAPNYLFTTKENKIWADYFNQKTTEDYTLPLIQNIEYLSDDDVYTHVKLFGKNEKPHNILIESGVTWTEKNQSYTGSAYGVELKYVGQDAQGRYLYETALSEHGRIFNYPMPQVYVNDVPIDNTIVHMVNKPIMIKEVTDSKSEGDTVDVNYTYWVILPHSDVFASGTVTIYMPDATTLFEIDRFDKNMNYEDGIYIVPIDYPTGLGLNLASMTEIIQWREKYMTETDDWFVGYEESKNWSQAHLNYMYTMTYNGYAWIDNEKMKYLKISSWLDGDLIKVHFSGVERGVDFTSASTHQPGAFIYFASGSDITLDSRVRQATLIQAATASYWVRYNHDKLQINYTSPPRFAIDSSLFNRLYRNDIVTADFHYADRFVATGETENLFDGRHDTQTQILFYAQPLPGLVVATIDMGSVRKIDAMDITAGFFYPDERKDRKFDISNFYSLQYSTDGSEYFHISPSAINFQLRGGESKSWENNTLGNEFKARYIKLVLENAQKIEYANGIWCVAISELAAYENLILVGEAKLVDDASLVDDTHVYDNFNLLQKVGDRTYKISDVNELLHTRTKVDYRAKKLLEEFVKNHTRAQVQIVYHPKIYLGQTVKLQDTVNDIDQNYFIESIADKDGVLRIVLGRYP